MGLLDDLNSMGLISGNEADVANGLARSAGRVVKRNIPATTDTYTTALHLQQKESMDYLNGQIQKYDALKEESGPLSYSNLTDNNPFISVPANIANFGTRFAGAVLDQVANFGGGVNISNANSEYSAIPQDIKDIYNREKLDDERDVNNTALIGIQNALGSGQESELIGYDKKYKTRSELDAHIKDLQSKVNSKPVTEEERLRIDNPDYRVSIGNSLLTPLRQSYRDVFNQIEQNYEDDRSWRGERAKGIDNVFGSRSWGNDYATKQFGADFQQADKANADLNKQGQFQRANSERFSPEYWEGVGKSLKAFGGSVGSATDSLQKNPMALVDMVAETAPFLVGRTANMAFAGDAERVLADGSQAIAQERGTPAIEGMDALGNVAAAGVYTGLNLVERNTLLGAVGGRNVGASTLDRIGESIGSVASRVTTKVADALPSSVANTARIANNFIPTGAIATTMRNAATAGALEGAVETAQTQIEDSWSKGKTDVDTSNLAQAGVLGAAMGAGFSAPGSVREVIGGRVADNLNAQATEQFGNTQSAIEDLTNVANPDFAPDKAINRILSQEMPVQNYEGAKDQIDTIVNGVNTQLNQMEERAKYFDDVSPLLQRIEAGNKILADFQANNTADTNPNYDLIVENYTNRIGSLQTMYDEISSPDFNKAPEVEAIEKLKQSLVNMEGPYKTFKDAYDAYTSTVNSATTDTNTDTDVDVDTNTDGMGTTDTTTATPTPTTATAEPQTENQTTEQEARKHLGAPTFTNLGRINQLITDDTVPAPIRENLRVVADALLLANNQKDIGKVSSQVTKGDEGFRGTEQYLDEMAKAIKTGDTGRQESLMRQVNQFVASRDSKLKAIQHAQQIADQTRKQTQVVKSSTSGWSAVEGKALPRSQFEKNNGILVNPHRPDGTVGADTLVEALTNDLAMINSTSQALKAMRNVPTDSFNSQANDLRDSQMTNRNNQGVDTTVDPMQSALDDFNQSQREANSWNENTRSELEVNTNDAPVNTDPITGSETNGQGITEASEQLNESVDVGTPTTGSVETNGTTPTQSTTTQEVKEYELQFDENGVGHNVPKSKPDVETETEAEVKAEPDSTPKPKPKKFNYRQTFKSKEEAVKYLAKHNKTDVYYVSTNDAGDTVIIKNTPADKQPKVSPEAVVDNANTHNTVVAEVAEQTEADQNVSEQSTEATQVPYDTSNDVITEYESGTTQETTKDTSPEGGMSVLNTEGETTTDFVAEKRTLGWRLQNLISTGFIQRVRQGFNSPLVNVPNYVGTLNQGDIKQISDSIKLHTGEDASVEQINLVDDFIKFNKAHHVNKYLRTIIRANKSPEYNYKYFADFLLNEKGELDENVATAISLSMYAWIGENASSIYADKRAMGKILGIKNVDEIPSVVANSISTIGTHQKTLASTLGQRAYQALQLTMLKDVDPSRQSKVEQMLGTLAIGAMVDMNLAERTRMRNGELYAMGQYTEGNIDGLVPSLWYRKPHHSVDLDRLKNNSAVYFIRPATEVNKDGSLRPTNFNLRLQNLHKETKGILPKLFGFDAYSSLPSLTPIKTLPRTFNEFGGTLPKGIKEALLKQQSLEYKLNMPMIDVLNTLQQSGKGSNAIGRILGYVDPESRHLAFEKTIRSVNQGIDRSLHYLAETVNLVEDKPFYLASTVWSNHRNGNTAGFNPQGDKLHRGFVSLNNDLLTVPTNQPAFDESGELTQYGMFLRGLAFRMEDVKINDNAVDKTLVAEFIPQYEAYINSNEVRASADALQSILEGTHTNADIDVLTNLLVKWEMGSLGLSALMAINDRNQAVKNGEASFDVRMSADSDGLVNGPSITNIMLNTGSATFNRSVGILPFAIGNAPQITSMQQLRKDPFAKDPYEQLAEIQKKYWGELPRNNTNQGLAVRALDYLDSEYGKRKGAKRALTPFNYGSGFDSVNRANARGTLNAVYERIEKAIMNQETSSNDVANVTLAINKLITYHNSMSTGKYKVPLVTVSEMVSGSMLTAPQEVAIKNVDMLLRGGVTTKALMDLMPEYIKARDSKTSLANTLFTAYNAVYNVKLEQAKIKKMQSGEAFVATDLVVESLSAEERQQVIKDSYEYMPLLATPMGIKSKGDMFTSIPLINMGKRWNSDNTIEVRFNSGFGNKLTEESTTLPSGKADKSNDTTTLKTDIRERVFETPGVGGLALYIQSHDAFVTYQVMQAMQAQNFHDANSTNAYDLVRMAQIQNKAFLEAVTISHIGKAFIDATTSTLKGYVKNMSEVDVATHIDVLTQLQKTLDKSIGSQVTGASFENNLAVMYGDYINSDINKLLMLKKQYAISQYATEGGSHIITEADRKDIDNRITELQEYKATAIAEAKVIGKALDDVLVEGNATGSILTAEDFIAETLEAEKKPSDTFRDELLAKREEFKDPKKLIAYVQNNLKKYLSQQGNKGKYATMYHELLSMANKVLPNNLEVNVIDGNTDVSTILDYADALKDGTTAWYSSDGKKSQINLRTDGDVLNSSVIVHEFMHAATANAISLARANPNAYPKVQGTLARLDRLYEFVKSKVTTADDPVIQYGVKNVDEFIATGLTNPKFMDYLDNIVDVSWENRGMNHIASAFRSFVNNILEVLYAVAGKGKVYGKTLSAYEALLLDTAEFVSNAEPLTNATVNKLGAPTQSAVNTVSEYTAKQVYDALDNGTLDPVFKDKLGSIISNVTDSLFNALPYKYARSSQQYTPDQLWNNALQNGRAPYTTSALQAGFKLTAQEQFAVEALEVALKEATKSGSVSTAYRTIAKGFAEAKANISVEDMHNGRWSDASASEKVVAQQKYDYIFKVGQSDYITRFTAMALGSQEFNKMLTIKLNHDLFAERGQPTFDKLINMANRFVNGATERMTRTIGSETIQGKLPMLAQLVIEIDLKNRNKAVSVIEGAYTRADNMANDSVNSVRNKLSGALANSPIKLFNNKYVNIVTNTLNAGKHGRSPIAIFDEIRNFRNAENPNQRLGFLGELANEVGDQNKAQLVGEKLLAYAKQNEGTAQRIRNVVKEDVLSHFADNGANLSSEQRSALTTSLLRTDVQSLLSTHGYKKIGELLTSRTTLNEEIRKYESLINDPVKLSRAKSLGWYMVSGQGNEALAKNPTLIAQGGGLGFDLAVATDEHIKDIDVIASLYAIKYTDKKQLDLAHDVMQSEMNRADNGGTYALVKYHESLAKESYETLFGNNVVSFTKGYMPNIMNPNKELVVASNPADKARLESAMYVKMATVNKSAIDPNTNTDAVMYYSEDAGSQRYVSGAMALYNYGRKGSEIEFIQNEFADAINYARSSINTDPSYDPRTDTDNHAIPTYDTEGNIIAFNYEMSGHVRDTYLERNNDFAEILGEYTSAGFNKVNQADQNKAVVDALLEQYKTGFNTDPRAYIYVGAGVSDSTLSQSWAMIPKEIREYIYKKTGQNGLYVHNQAYLTVFGTKKYSITTAFDKQKEYQNIAEQLFTGFMRAIFRDNARVRTARGERIWQESVGLLKNIVVIRNVSTALINIISNSFLLLAHGVNPKDIVKHSIEAVKAGGEFRKASAELIKLQNRQRIEVGNADAIQERINMLQQRIEKNPLIDVIRGGMFSGIVEDIDPDNMSYTYASGMQRKYEGIIDKVPKTVRNVAKHAFVAPGTPLYQFLHSATQYGDFAAKYALFKHYTEKAPQLLSHDRAITKANNNFINYDVPTSQGLQYANDMGLVMFTKYNLRIQRALFELMAKRPASVIGQALIISALTRLPTGIDPMVFNQIGNPLRNGPVGLFGALDEPFPIQMMGNLF